MGHQYYTKAAQCKRGEGKSPLVSTYLVEDGHFVSLLHNQLSIFNISLKIIQNPCLKMGVVTERWKNLTCGVCIGWLLIKILHIKNQVKIQPITKHRQCKSVLHHTMYHVTRNFKLEARLHKWKYDITSYIDQF